MPIAISNLGSDPLTLISAPLALGSNASLTTMDAGRRKKLQSKRHFLVRGLGWLEGCHIPLDKLYKSDARKGVLDKLPTRSDAWKSFCHDWAYDRKEADLGVGLVREYIAHNHPDTYLAINITKPDSRFLSLYRASGFAVTLDNFAQAWFENPLLGAQRREFFKNYFARDYGRGFVFSETTIEPVIFKLGNANDVFLERLFGAWPLEPNTKIEAVPFDNKFLSSFETEIIAKFWPDTHTALISAKEVLWAIFCEDRCSDIHFMTAVATHFGAFYETMPPAVRVGTNFQGPKKSIILQRFYDVLVVTPPRWPVATPGS